MAYYSKNAIIHNQRAITYGQFAVQVKRLAEKLRNYGVKESDRVAVLSNNSIEYLVAFYGIAKLGAILIPVDKRFKANEIERMFHLFDVQHCVYSVSQNQTLLDQIVFGNVKNHLYEYHYDVVEEEILLREEFQQIVHRETYKEDFLIQYTSGSTGIPKGIVHTQNSLYRIHENWSSTVGLSCEEQFLCTYVLTSAHATDIFILPSLMNGATLHIMDSEKVFPRFVAQYICKNHITVYTSLDYFFRLLNEDMNIKKEQLDSLQYIFSGSAPLTEDVGQNFYRKFGKYLGNIYGMAEIGPSHVNLHVEKDLSFSSIGKNLRGMESRIVDDMGQEVKCGEEGEVLLKSDAAAKGYWNNKAESDKVFLEDGWISTKDFGRQDSNGNYYIVGRKSQFVNINGNKVSPDEVEDVINQYDGVKECAVIGIDQGEPNERLVAFIATKDRKINIDRLNSFCIEHLAAFKLCKEYIEVTSLPRGENGKLLKKKLEEHYKEKMEGQIHE